jgi:hypothetical protein
VVDHGTDGAHFVNNRRNLACYPEVHGLSDLCRAGLLSQAKERTLLSHVGIGSATSSKVGEEVRSRPVYRGAPRESRQLPKGTCIRRETQRSVGPTDGTVPMSWNSP